MTNDKLPDKNRKITESNGDTFFSSYRVEVTRTARRLGLVCPNCGADLEGRKCKLLCVGAGYGYQVTCSEW